MGEPQAAQEPGDEVVCEMIKSSEGRILAATRRAD
jgi:hypothetical protein